MVAPTASEALLEQDAQALSRLWLDARRSRQQCSDDVAPLLAAAQARGEPRTLCLSLAFESLHLWAFCPRHADTAPAMAAIQARLRAAGWRRAIELAEAAVALVHTYDAEPDPHALGPLNAHDADAAQPRPAIERVWTAAALSVLHAGRADYDQALAWALRAEALARESGHDFAVMQAMQALAFTFLSVGDVEGAVSVLPAGIAASQRCGLSALPLHYNLLLAWVVSGRYNEAAQWLAREPAAQAAPALSRVNALCALVALVWAHSGRAEAAAALLAQPEHVGLAGVAEEPPAMQANRLWLRAATKRALGHSVAARAELEVGLAQLAAAGAALSPLNGTQLYRVLSEACEACGDFRASLAALKRSQGHCFQWVSASVRSRLQVLHSANAQADGTVQSQRLLAVDEAVHEAVHEAVNATEARAEHGSDGHTLQRQRRYLQHVTHEMRNPLAGIIGMTSLLMMSDLDDRQRQHLGMAQMSAQMLLALCNDVLDLAKLEAGRFELHPQPVDVADVLSAATGVFRPMAEAQGLTLNCRIDPALPRSLCCDRLRLQQVLMNLLSNATKFTRQGSIVLTADWRANASSQASQALHVRVQDTGPGLDAAARSRLFQEFSQADASVAQRHGGTGLGLALCRSLVTLMGGDIGVDSSPGQGSTFWFFLPLSPA
jgi:signal transduction histidine kinase